MLVITPPNDNPPLSRLELIDLINTWGNNPSQENADKIINANTSEIIDMSNIFYPGNREYDGSAATNISNMNLDISAWDVSNVRNMNNMFSISGEFNQDISSWDVSKVTDMSTMFMDAYSFNQDISAWDVSNVSSSNDFATASALQDSYNPFN